MKKLIFRTALICFFCFQKMNAQWNVNPYEHKEFVENKGQFDDKGKHILYGVNNLGAQLYFSNKGLIIRCDKLEAKQITERKNHDEEEDDDNELQKAEYKTSIVQMEWLGANPNTTINAENEVSNYYNYGNAKDLTKSVYFCKAYKKLIYKNIYPKIDIEYVFHPEKGFKYTLILHAGSDISKVKMKYHVTDKKPQLKNGAIYFSTNVGVIVDHQPLSFYEGSGSEIKSSFLLNDNIVSFKLENYDHSKSVIIDPWVIVPALPTNNKALEIQKDNLGNSYVYGGTTPYTLNKYDPSGVLIWTLGLPLSITTWTGDLLVDDAGFSYVTNAGTSNNICKINNSTGFAVWCVTSGPGEYFRLVFNCDKSKIYAAGAMATMRMMLINQTTGSATATTSFFFGREIKSITRAPNGNFYALSSRINLYVTEINSSLTSGWDMATPYPPMAIDYHHPYYISPGPAPGSGSNGGMNGIAANEKFVYAYEGRTLYKRNICDGALLGSVVVPNAVLLKDGGIQLDSCGNIYVGSTDGVYQYNAGLTQIGFAATPDTVYDISMGINPGELLVCGKGFATNINMLVCQPIPFSATCYNLVTSVSSTPAGCSALCDGTATVTPTVGIPPYSYSWAPGGQTTSTITALCSGTYTVTVRDKFNYCNAGVPVTITTGTAPLVTANSTAASICIGNSTTLSSGGAVSYSWAPSTGLSCNNCSNPVASPISSTTYTVTGTNASGCTNTATVTITVATCGCTLSAQTNSISNVDCYGANTGSASITLSGSSGTYTYSWSNGTSGTTTAVTITKTNISAGAYTVTFTDASGCTSTTTANIIEPPALIGQFTKGTTDCTSCGCKEWVMVTATGGTNPYSYLWPNGYANRYKNHLCPGTNTINIMDKNGCSVYVVVSTP